jgi:hypothetical protein
MLALLSSAGIASRAGVLVSWHPDVHRPTAVAEVFVLDGGNRGQEEGYASDAQQIK